MMEVYYFTVLEAGSLLSHSSGGQKSRVKVWQVRFLDRARFMVCRQQPSHCVLSGGGWLGGKDVGDWSGEIERGEEGEREKEKERPLPLLMRTLILLDHGPTHMTLI